MQAKTNLLIKTDSVLKTVFKVPEHKKYQVLNELFLEWIIAFAPLSTANPG